ncbi:MAG: hypothetical protein LBU61_00390 [Coriobacteriales bacterium]|jgi:hypothetical protein|nr:hypothetical protein [Coriobacteriales bacterium]
MKAVIISHEDNGTYVLDRTGSFRYVKGYATKPVGLEIELTAQPVQINRIRTMAVAASFVLALMVGSFAWLWNAEKYSVYMDINPSVVMKFNYFDQLIAVDPVNHDGEILLADLVLKGPACDVVITLIQAAEQDGYLDMKSDPPLVLITVIANNSNVAEKQTVAIVDALFTQGLPDLAIIQACSPEYRDRVVDLGVSPGKLLLAERLQAADPNLVIEDLVLLPTKELLAAATGVVSDDGEFYYWDKDNPNQGPGNNNGKEVENPNQGAGNNSGNNDPNPNQGAGNNNGNNTPNPNQGAGNNNGKDDPNPNQGAGNNSSTTTNPNQGPGISSGNPDPNPNQGPNSSIGNTDPNPNQGPGHNNGNPDPNPNQGPGQNNGNPDPNPNQGPGSNNGNPNPNKGPGHNNGMK